MIVIKGTKELIEQYYGGPQKKTFKSIVAIDDGNPVGVAGLRLIDSKMVAFISLSDELRKHKSFKRTVAKGCREWLKMLSNLPIYATCDPKIKGAKDLLIHMGFEHIEGDVWRR